METVKSRNVSIDAMRFLFSVIVVLHHSRYVLGDENCYFLGGSLAVEFFFFVSGYLLLADVEKQEKREAFTGRAFIGRGYAGSDFAGSGFVGRGFTESGFAEGGKEKLGTETWHFIRHKLSGFLPEFLISWWIGFFVIGAVRRLGPVALWKALEKDVWELTLVKMSGLFTGGINGAMWYLSAMLLVMAVLYPLLRKNKDLMTHVVCPLLALFFYGYLCRTEGHPRDPLVWMGLCYKGLLRAAAGLCCGAVIYLAVGNLRRKAPRGLTRAGQALVILLQLLCLSLVIRYMALRKPSQYDYFYLFLLMILVLLSFSGFGLETLLSRCGERGKSAAVFLGKYSLPLYLGHLYFAQHINEILAPKVYSGRERMAAYLILSVLNGFVVMGLAGLWRKKQPEKKLRSLLVK